MLSRKFTLLYLALCCLWHFSEALDDRLRWEADSKVRQEADRIVSLPGLNPMPTFKMFSGYLDASEEEHLFYWLVF